MDCSKCRSHFSTSFDGRLVGEGRLDFARHLGACGTCQSDYATYRRVFAVVRGLPEIAAGPFRPPAEVPGAFATPTRSSFRPRFARAAAGLLILLGLVGTHALVFNWSRDRAAVTLSGPAIAPAAMPPVAMASLPGILRDHVDATDLFIKTASQVPEQAGPQGVDLIRADWAASNLVARTADLRRESEHAPADQKYLIDGYLDVFEDFLPAMRSVLEDARQPSVITIRQRATVPRLQAAMNGLRVTLASAPRGTTYAACCWNDLDACTDLKADGRAIIESKLARLAGDFNRAIAGFRRFDAEFAGSTLRPTARYLLADSLFAAEQYADGGRLLRQVPYDLSRQPADNVMQLVFVVVGSQGQGSVKIPVLRAAHDRASWHRLVHPGVRTVTASWPMKSEAPIPLQEDLDESFQTAPR